MTIRLRPLWLSLLALAWAFLTIWWTPTLDQAAARLGAWTGTEPTDLGGAAIWSLPWLAAGAVFLAASLAWIVVRPAWHPWRDTAWSVLWAVPATVAPYVMVNTIDLWRTFGHYEHTAVDIVGLGMHYTFGAFTTGLFAIAGIATALVAANRIWATPTPLRDETFGPRQAA